MASEASAGAKAEEDDYSGDEEEELRAKNQCGISIRYMGREDDTNLVLAPMTITFGKLLNRYAKVRGLDPAGFRLLQDGTAFTVEQTPKMMEWKAGRRYELDCMAAQEGG